VADTHQRLPALTIPGLKLRQAEPQTDLTDSAEVVKSQQAGIDQSTSNLIAPAAMNSTMFQAQLETRTSGDRDLRGHIQSITLFLLLAVMPATHAVDVYSNLGNPDSSSNAAIGFNDVLNFDVYYAQGFTTGVTLYNIDSVDLALGVTNAGNGTPLLRLYSDNAGNPGSDLGAVFTNPTFGTRAIYNFSLASPFALAASTSYWLVLSDSTAGSNTKFNWYYSDTFSSPSARNGSGFTFLNGGRSIDGGINWTTNTNFAQTGVTVNATAVPEPTSSLLGLMASGILGMVARQRKNRSA